MENEQLPLWRRYLDIPRPRRYSLTFVAAALVAGTIDIARELATNDMNVHQFDYTTVETGLAVAIGGYVFHRIGVAKDREENS